MATISSLNVLVSADTKRLISGMKKGGKSVKGFSAGLKSSLGMVTGFGAALGALAAGGGALMLLKKAFGDLDSLGKMSDQLGISTEMLAGFRHGAALTGSSSQAMDKSLQRFVRTLGEAQAGITTAERGFKMLGLSASDMANMDTGSAFLQTAEAISQLSSPAEKAAAAYAVFGRQGQELLNFLDAGQEGIEGFVADAESLGIAMDREGAAKAEMFNDSMLRLNSMFQGVAQTLAVELAPFLTALVDHFIGIGTSGGGMGKRVVDAFGWILKAVAKVQDYFSLFKAAFYGLQGAVMTGIKMQVDAWGFLAGAIDKVLGLFGVDSEVAEFFEILSDELNTAAETSFEQAGQAWEDFENGVASQNAEKAIQKIQAEMDAAAQAIADAGAANRNSAADAEAFAEAMRLAEANAKKVTSTMESLQKQVDTFGFSKSEKTLFDLQAMNATEDQIAEAMRLIGQLEELEAQQSAIEADQKAFEDMAKSAAGVFEDTRTPLENYGTQLEELGTLLDKGAIDWETYSRAVEQASESMKDQNEASVAGSPEAQFANSQSGQRFIFAMQNQNRRQDEIPRRQLAVEEEHLRTSIAMLAAVENLNTEVVDI